MQLGEARHAPDVGGDVPVVASSTLARRSPRRGSRPRRAAAPGAPFVRRAKAGTCRAACRRSPRPPAPTAARSSRSSRSCSRTRRAARSSISRMPSSTIDRELVRERGIVGAAVRNRRCDEVAAAVLMLQAFAAERRPARRRADQEAARALVGGGPDQVADALEAEHRVVDVERQHRAGRATL